LAALAALILGYKPGGANGVHPGWRTPLGQPQSTALRLLAIAKNNPGALLKA